jgi:hypothetical protein
VVRLNAALETLRSRITRREIGHGLDWHLARAEALDTLLRTRALDDFVVDTDGKTAIEVANEVISVTGFG